jgi:hypothetical protein
MKTTPLVISQVILLESKLFGDDRGYPLKALTKQDLKWQLTDK